MLSFPTAKNRASPPVSHQEIWSKSLSFPSQFGSDLAAQDTNNQIDRKRAAMNVSTEVYHEETTDTLPSFLANTAGARGVMEALHAKDASELEAVEMGDGNLNLVFIVTNKNQPDKQVIVKQALPYVRCVGESWPMTLDRAYFEYTALTACYEACPEFVPKVYYFSRTNALMVMQYIRPPNIILRKGLIQGIRYPTMASDLGVFCGKTLFHGSGFKLQPKELREKVEFWSKNSEMCALTEQGKILDDGI